MNGNKFVTLLKSRKFWASVVGILVTLGVVSTTDEVAVAQALNIIAGIIATYVFATGVEDINKPVTPDIEEEKEEAGNVARRRK